ncbi:hypothetical protein [Trichocoleus sp. FACHB-262]|uniref:hypothetical protein n=1 Tax=Trichocoleus sp. FACHB-262 TaxID=2692869 RepID=UPI001685F5C8|nr:hypothetical protein [Trichocoleus sp. FACHB-262]MBD2122894.1 hypothetical protein [Trichocoleus sp. FACHB-262]
MLAASNTPCLQSNGYQTFGLVNKHEAARILGVSPETLKKYRLQPESSLIEGIHYHVWNPRTIRYNPNLIADWGLNRAHPEQHQKTIEAYIASLPSNQRKRGRRAS